MTLISKNLKTHELIVLSHGENTPQGCLQSSTQDYFFNTSCFLYSLLCTLYSYSLAVLLKT